LGRRTQAEGPVPLKGDVGRGSRRVENKQSRNRRVAAGPLDPETLDRPEAAEGAQKNPDDELQQAPWNATDRLVQRKADCSNDHDYPDSAHHTRAQLGGSATEG